MFEKKKYRLSLITGRYGIWINFCKISIYFPRCYKIIKINNGKLKRKKIKFRNKWRGKKKQYVRVIQFYGKMKKELLKIQHKEANKQAKTCKIINFHFIHLFYFNENPCIIHFRCIFDYISSLFFTNDHIILSL